jgi:hypothetical protein
MTTHKSFDVFPALLVSAPPGSLSDITELNIIGDKPQGTKKLDRCRAALIEDLLIVATDGPDGIKVVFRERIVESAKVEKTHYVKTISGKILAITKDVNCGCGTKLRGWNPYGSFIPSAQDPK